MTQPTQLQTIDQLIEAFLDLMFARAKGYHPDDQQAIRDWNVALSQDYDNRYPGDGVAAHFLTEEAAGFPDDH